MAKTQQAKKPLLITGGSGYLGRHLTAKAVNSFQVYTTYSRHAGRIKAGHSLFLDLTRRADVLDLITNLSPQAIIHTAAINPGQGGEEEMWQVNVEGSRHVAESAVAIGARLVHLSSDMIHSGRNAPYTDEVPPSPVNSYGRSKAEAEAIIAQIEPKAIIVRTSLIYGLEVIDRGTESFIERLDTGHPLVLFNDVVRQPVWVETLAEALLKLIDVKANFAGTLNIAGRQALTREEFGQRLLAWWGVEAGFLLQSGRAADISETIPLDLRLTVAKAEQLLQMTFPGVDEVLAQETKRRGREER